MFEIHKETFQYGQHTVTLETGEIARQAGGSVIVTVDDTVVLATVVAAKSAKPGQDFFPLTVAMKSSIVLTRSISTMFLQYFFA